MQKSILSLSISIGLVIVGFGQTTFAGQETTTRTGPNGNSAVTNRTYGGGSQTTTRTGPNGNSAVSNINRSYGNGSQTTTRTGPNGNTGTTTRSFNK
jgi:hypothetical protein